MQNEILNLENHEKIKTSWLGKVSYSMALDIQADLVGQVFEGRNSYILGLEHPKVVTLGKRGDLKNDLRVSLSDLDAMNFQYYRVDRGGHATLHSPGQLVIYPVVSLENLGIGVRDFVCKIQKTTQTLLGLYNIETFQVEKDPGLYTLRGKIAFFGIRVQRGITYHGLSLNVSNHLEDFDVIKSCGKENEKFDRVGFYDSNATSQDLFEKWCDLFKKII